MGFENLGTSDTYVQRDQACIVKKRQCSERALRSQTARIFARNTLPQQIYCGLIGSPVTSSPQQNNKIALLFEHSTAQQNTKSNLVH